MNGIQSQATEDFDLRTLRPLEKRVKRIPLQSKVGGVVALTCVSGILAAASLYNFERTRDLSVDLLAVAVLSIAAGVLAVSSALSIPVDLPGPVSIRISGLGLTCRFQDGSESTYEWSDRRLRLTIFDYSDSPLWVDAGLSYVLRFGPRIWGFGPYHPRALITRAVVESVLATAESKHLRVVSYRGSRIYYRTAPIIHSIRPTVK